MNRHLASRLIAVAALATLPVLSACTSMETMSGDMKKTPAQTSQNPARQMHYSQPASNGRGD
jgi:hypothetical protein